MNSAFGVDHGDVSKAFGAGGFLGKVGMLKPKVAKVPTMPSKQNMPLPPSLGGAPKKPLSQAQKLNNLQDRVNPAKPAYKPPKKNPGSARARIMGPGQYR